MMKYDSQLISVKHRKSIPRQKWLPKYSQLWASQKSFDMDKKHVTFNLSDALYYHTYLWFNVLNSYTNNLSQFRCSHVQTLRITQIHYLPQYNCIYMDEWFFLQLFALNSELSIALKIFEYTTFSISIRKTISIKREKSLLKLYSLNGLELLPSFYSGYNGNPIRKNNTILIF